MDKVQALWARYRNSLLQFGKFGLIGGAGVVVNQFVVVVCNVLGRDLFGVGYNTAVLNLFGSEFHVRLLQVYAILAFLVANLFNFVLNRYWTFRGHARAPFWKEYLPFLLVGSVAAVVGLFLLTWLTKSDWPLPHSVFDDSTGLRNRFYWANLIQIVLVMPVNFVLNKLWTFQAVRKRHAEATERKADALNGSE
ncbi:GtrA family protein [Propionicicella superfundia]|uniref:GtrA family protein n=1 Tax=Propionicicella superfundia TaxID=348582 RepID=UPI00040629D4|nr:GtrA family protein [Propionicicella superfundia]